MNQSELFNHASSAPDAQAEVERWAQRSGHRRILGVDEAGRGPLAGPVYVGCVAADLQEPPAWADRAADSKALAAEERDQLFDAIRRSSAAWSIQLSPPAEIDDVNILQATRRAMARSIESVCISLSDAPDGVYIDGDDTTDLNRPQRAVVDGDARSWTIAAASILAKVARDRFMIEQHRRWPQYGFDSHKGYPTPAHLDALRKHGPSPIHRRSFKPVREASADDGSSVR